MGESTITDLHHNPFSPTQQQFIAYAPKPASLLSIACSIFMIQRILRDPLRKKKVYHRIILALSVHTIIFCLGMFFGTWPMPKDSLTANYGAMGTDKTCTAQGFIVMFETMTVASLYLSLSLFSFLAVRNDFKEQILRKYEFWLHTFIYVIPLTMACIALKQGFINPEINQCFIDTVPMGCASNDSIECLHDYTGINEYVIFCFGYIYLTLIVALLLTVSLYLSEKKKEKRNERMRGRNKHRENARKLKSRIVLTQSGLYLWAFVCTYIIPIIFRNLKFCFGTRNFPLYALGLIMISLQGVLNLFVYQRLSLSKRSLSASSKELKLEPLKKRVSLSNSCTGKMLCIGDQPEFSIFDGTHASEVWSSFIHESSQCEEDEKSEEGTEAIKEKDKTNEECIRAVQLMTIVN